MKFFANLRSRLLKKTSQRAIAIILIAIIEYLYIHKFLAHIDAIINPYTSVLKLDFFVSMVLSSPIAFLLWSFRDSNKRDEIENERNNIENDKRKILNDNVKLEIDRIALKQADFHRLEEWLANKQYDTSLRLVAAHQLEPYLRADEGYPIAFQEPCCALYLGLLEEWSDKIRAFIKRNGGKHNFEIEPHIHTVQQIVLRNINLIQQHKNHHRIDLSFSKNQKIALKNANLVNVQFEYADLEEAQLINANFRRASLFRAHLEKAILSDAILTEANCYGASLDSANLSRANLEKVEFDEAIVEYANFENAIFSSAIKTDKIRGLDKANLKGTILYGRIPSRYHYEKATLSLT